MTILGSGGWVRGLDHIGGLSQASLTFFLLSPKLSLFYFSHFLEHTKVILASGPLHMHFLCLKWPPLKFLNSLFLDIFFSFKYPPHRKLPKVANQQNNVFLPTSHFLSLPPFFFVTVALKIIFIWLFISVIFSPEFKLPKYSKSLI